MAPLTTQSGVALGCWPIAGITSVGVTAEQSRATVAAARDAGVTHFDTAHAYGYDGESERIVGEVLRPIRSEVFVATKCGLVWGPPMPDGSKRSQTRDGRPETLKRQCDESLRRLGFEAVDLLYLHAPDPTVPIEEQAAALESLWVAGKAHAIGVSNFDSHEQYEAFHAVCPIAFDQQPFNLLQRGMEQHASEWARQHNVRMAIYWPLMKGLLAGKITRDHVFEEGDSRPRYDVFQGKHRSLAHDVIDRLSAIASEVGCTVAQLVVAATIARPTVDVVLCGAKRPEQIIETAAAAMLRLDDDVLAAIESACAPYLEYDG